MAPEASSSRPPRRRASVTLVSLCMTTALGIALGSYIALCTRSTQFSSRLVQQDRALEFAHIGIEEALWALNQNTWTASGPDGTGLWTTSGADRTITLTYPLAGQGGAAQVTVAVTNYAATGPTWPGIQVAATVTHPGGLAFSRTLQATTGPAPLFGNAIASAESYVSFVATGVVDSWNSDPDNNPATPTVAYSFTAGSSANYNAVVAGRTNGTHGVVLTQATVKGYVATSGQPVSYSTSGSPAGSVVGPATAAGVNVDSARLGKSAFVPVAPTFAVVLPPTTGSNFGGLISNVLDLVAALLSIPPGTDTFKTTGSFAILGIPLLSPSLTIDQPMKLIVAGDLAIAGAGRITITPTGSLELFVAGDLTIGGNGILNQTNDPKKLAIFCTSSSTVDPVEFTTGQNFCGVIYCENKPIDIRQNATFHGALLSRQYVRFSASATSPIFHYDSALRQTRFAHVSTPFVVRQVSEP